MHPPQIHIGVSPRETALAFAEWLSGSVTHSEAFHWALSGGSTPQLLFDLLAAEYRERIAWRNVHFWWGDERCVPPDHAESNYRMTVEHLLAPLGIPEYQIHRMRGEADPETEALRAGAEILEYVPGHNGLPRFDLLMLGMGTDGHTLSIFPHQMELLRDPRICAIGIHPESGQQRITLTGPVAAQAARIAFLVTGAAKAPIIQAIQEGLPESQHYPAAHIRAQSGELHWFMDVAAAG